MMVGQINFRAMGCQMAAVLDTPRRQDLEVLQEVPGWFETWEQTFSRFRPDSELARVNQQAGKPVTVSPVFAEVFDQARQAAGLTGGLVTPTIYTALVAAGYAASFETLGEVGQTEQITGPVPGMEAIGWNAGTRTLQLPAGLQLDFGGVAKGWAAWQAMRRMQSFGDVLVDAGGDIALSEIDGPSMPGRVPGRRKEPWIVGVARPYEGETLEASLSLRGGGVATSGREYRRWQQSGRWRHHLIDPRTGQPAETDVVSVTVVAPTLWQAEAAAKRILIAGSQDGLDWLAAIPEFAALVFLEHGERRCSPNWNRYLWEAEEDAYEYC